jgi:ribonuclease HI
MIMIITVMKFCVSINVIMNFYLYNIQLIYRVAGAGGVIINSRGNVEIIYAWSLDIATNNQVEEYALIQGVLLAKEREIQDLIIIGDSSHTIKSLVKRSMPRYVQLSSIVKKNKARTQGYTRSHL